MNTEDVITDLKQFISATVSQQTSDLQNNINALDKKLSEKIDDLSSSVADALDASNQATDEQLQNHERRITKLEQAAS